MTLERGAAAVGDTRRSVAQRIDQALTILRRDLSAAALATVTAGASMSSASEAADVDDVESTMSTSKPLHDVASPIAASGTGSPSRAWRYAGKLATPAGLLAAAAATIVVLIAAFSGRFGANSSGGVRSDINAYDQLAAAYVDQVDPQDALAFPAMITSLASDRRSLWRGTNILLLNWCQAHAADWLKNDTYRVVSPGLVRLEALGSYTTGSTDMPRAVGLLDLDDGARLPFQIDLLQAIVSVRQAARDNGLSLQDSNRRQLEAAVFDGYRAAYAAKPGTPAPVEIELTASMLRDRPGIGYPALLERYVQNNRFRPVVRPIGAEPPTVLLPAPDQIEPIGVELRRVLWQSTVMRRAFRFREPENLRRAVLDIVRRPTNSGGLKEYLVLVRRPLRTADHDVILQIRKQIAPSAERLGLSVYDQVAAPGRRIAERWLTNENSWPLLANWCELENEHYHITLMEPEQVRLDVTALQTLGELADAGRLLGYHLGKIHRDRNRSALSRHLTPDCFAAIANRASAFMASMERDYDVLRQDPRIRSDAARLATVLEHSR